MFFLVNFEKKIIFGTTQKCGCTFIKNLFRHVSGIEKSVSIRKYSFNDIKNFEDFTIVFFIRNIYERIVSVFNDKYNYIKNPDYVNYYSWKSEKLLNFKNFVFKIQENFLGKWDLDYNHLQYQFGNEITEEKLKVLKNNNKVYSENIKNINYSKFSSILKTVIHDEIINFSTEHSNKQISNKSIGYNISELSHDQLKYLKYTYDDFYTKELKDIILNIYFRDNKEYLSIDNEV